MAQAPASYAVEAIERGRGARGPAPRIKRQVLASPHCAAHTGHNLPINIIIKCLATATRSSQDDLV
eukprot:1689821-Prymnesium_polylepis.1